MSVNIDLKAALQARFVLKQLRERLLIKAKPRILKLMRPKHGHTLVELIVIIGMLSIVVGLLYSYYNSGYKFFNKAFNFGLLQRNARVSLEDLSQRIKHASRDYIYTDTSFSQGVPFPSDALIDKPYIYFAVPNIDFDIDRSREQRRAQAKPQVADTVWRVIEPIAVNPFKRKKSKLEEKAEQGVLASATKYSTVKSYDYYLYYFAAPKSDPESEYGPLLTKSARLKVLRYKDQSTEYTENQLSDWPFLPPELTEEDIPDQSKIKKSGYVGHVESKDVTPEFSIYKSNVIFDYSGDNYNKLFIIKVNFYDEGSDTRVNFETAVAPRN